MALYEFDQHDAFDFARFKGINVSRRGDELRFERCPYCEGGRHHDKDTFAISLKTGAFNCKRAQCAAKGNMLTLHQDFGFPLSGDVDDYERSRETYKRYSWTRPEPKSAAVKYLTGRGISEDVINRYGVTTKKNDDNVLAFPFVDEHEIVALIKYRAINFDKSKGGSKEWSEPGMRSVLFGMHQCEDHDQLVITEGQIDSLSVATAGIKNACSVPTGKNGMRWIPNCWDWIRQFKRIVVFGDNEHGEITLAKDITERFLSEACTVAIVRPEDYLGCKDANEILQKFGPEQIRKAIDRARPVMLDQVMQLRDVVYTDQPERMLPTGFREIDAVLSGGFQFGTLNIITGKRGDGKSTFSSMLTKAALEDGQNVFLYSGEMRVEDVRKWLDRQIAGSARVEISPMQQNNLYSVSKANRDIISEWLTDRAYIYDTGKIIENPKSITDVIELYMKQFACKFVLIDNLMTAIDLYDAPGEKFAKQELLCKALARLAQKYNAVILLVAHQKKGESGNINDDVLGSSEITNLAGTVLSYSREKKMRDEDRLVRITKNRKTGRLNYSGIVVTYDEVSKRIFGNSKTETDGASIPSRCFGEYERSKS